MMKAFNVALLVLLILALVLVALIPGGIVSAAMGPEFFFQGEIRALDEKHVELKTEINVLLIPRELFEGRSLKTGEKIQVGVTEENLALVQVKPGSGKKKVSLKI